MPIATRRARDPRGAGIVTWRFTWISDGTAYPVPSRSLLARWSTSASSNAQRRNGGHHLRRPPAGFRRHLHGQLGADGSLPLRVSSCRWPRTVRGCRRDVFGFVIQTQALARNHEPRLPGGMRPQLSPQWLIALVG